jgi:hypothetical protein
MFGSIRFAGSVIAAAKLLDPLGVDVESHAFEFLGQRGSQREADTDEPKDEETHVVRFGHFIRPQL